MIAEHLTDETPFESISFARTGRPIPAARILLVHSSESDRFQLRRMLRDLSADIAEVESTFEAARFLLGNPIDLILIDVDQFAETGRDLCRLLKKTPNLSSLPVLVLSASSEIEEEVFALESGADEYLRKPVHPAVLQVRVEANLRRKTRFESADDAEMILCSLAQSVEERDPGLGPHCQRMATLAVAMGLALNLHADEITTLRRAGFLHDIGKIGIPDKVLFKAGPLDAAEWEVMKSHATRGEKICSHTKSLSAVLPIIRHHHEKWDGTGYPDGLAGEQIPLLARIIQIADIYDALTTPRPYKPAYSSAQALEILEQEVEKCWRDPQLVQLLKRILPVVKSESDVDLSSLSLQALATSVRSHAQ